LPSNVQLKSECRVVKLETATEQKIEQKNGPSEGGVKVIGLGGKCLGDHSHVVSTLFAPATNRLLPKQSQSEDLAAIEAVDVLVVNLFYREKGLLPVRGFGYLVPKSVPFEENPERVLGVIFDSETAERGPGTAVTVMMGGHWWNGNAAAESSGVQLAQKVLKHHLNISAEPIAACSTLQRQCIPQYYVGHEERLGRIHQKLLGLDGAIRVAGASYRGVGINDCIKSARDLISQLSNPGATGLEMYSSRGMPKPELSFQNAL
jgi:oxygen-dependent protoporphyrinogen oxidase